ncbi:MAG: phage portal protein [Prevotella sp.]|nr:phage portal protein [Prevotella sp.]
MKLFGKKEKRAENNNTEITVTYDGDFFSALVGAGNHITKQKALEIPAVQFCVELFSGLVSALPVKLYEEDGDGRVTEIKDDVRVRLLNGDTGDTVNGTMFRRLWVHDYFLGGGAYAYIERDVYGMPCALYYVDESRLTVIPNGKAIFKDYSVSVDGAVYPKSDFLKILRNSKGNGRGTSVVSESGTMLATSYNTMLYENSVVKKGGNKKGFFTSQNQQTQGAMQSIKEAWRKMNSSNQGVEDNVCVLNAGMDFKEVSLSSMDMQLNQNKQTNSGEICGLFGVPFGMMSGNVSDTAKGNFITDTFTPLLNIFETAFDSDLLLETEKGRRYFAFDTRELTRGDILKRYQAYAIGKKNGFVMIDDIRKLEDMPPINFPFINLGLADVLYNPETGEIYTPNTDTVINIRNKGHKIGVSDSDIPEEVSDGREELRYNHNHDPKTGKFTSGGGSSSKGLTKGRGSVKLDSKGNPYSYPELRLPKKEYGKVMHEIDTLYHSRYEGKKRGWVTISKDTYYFEIHEFNEYNIYKKWKDED